MELQKKLNKIGIGLLVLSVILPFTGLVLPISIRILNFISYGLIVVALILFGKTFWKWYGKEHYVKKNPEEEI